MTFVVSFWPRPKKSLPVVLFVLLACGCREPGTSPTYRAGGKVMYRGQPLPEVSVTCTPERGRPAVGITDSQGRFTLSTYRPGDGAVPGTHIVTISPTYHEPPPMTVQLEETSNRSLPYPAKYCRLDASDLKVDVHPRRVNEFILELKDH